MVTSYAFLHQNNAFKRTVCTTIVMMEKILWAQCRRYGGARGSMPPKRLFVPPFRFTQNIILEHHVTTRQQATMEKGIITFKNNSRLKISRFFAKLLAMSRKRDVSVYVSRKRNVSE